MDGLCGPARLGSHVAARLFQPHFMTLQRDRIVRDRPTPTRVLGSGQQARAFAPFSLREALRYGTTASPGQP